jgi:hypothetical protein
MICDSITQLFGYFYLWGDEELMLMELKLEATFSIRMTIRILTINLSWSNSVMEKVCHTLQK